MPSLIEEPTDIHEWFTKIAKGCVPGHTIRHIIGHNPEIIQTTDPEDLWEAGDLLIWQINADTLAIVSDNASDNVAGLGARKVIVEGLDADFNEISEEVELDGLTPVTTQLEYIRVNHFEVSEVGTYHSSNLGNIVATYTTTTDIATQIGIADGHDHSSHITVPADKIGFIYHPLLQIDANKTATVFLNIVENADVLLTSVRQTHLWFDGISNFDFNFVSPIRTEEKSDIWWTVDSVSASSSIIIHYELLLVDSRIVE